MVKSKANGAFDILGDRDCPPIGTRTKRRETEERRGGARLRMTKRERVNAVAIEIRGERGGEGHGGYKSVTSSDKLWSERSSGK